MLAEAGRDRPATNSAAPQPKARAAAEGEGPAPPAPEVGTEPWEEARPREGAARSPPCPPHLSLPAAPRGPLLPDAAPWGPSSFASRPVIRLGCLFNFLPRMAEGRARKSSWAAFDPSSAAHTSREDTHTETLPHTIRGTHLAHSCRAGLRPGGLAGARQGGHGIAPTPLSPRPGSSGSSSASAQPGAARSRSLCPGVSTGRLPVAAPPPSVVHAMAPRGQGLRGERTQPEAALRLLH